MKRYIKSDESLGITVLDDGYVEDVFCMTRLNPKKTGLKYPVWSDAQGISRNNPHQFTPRAKIIVDGKEVSVTIEPNPKIVVGKSAIKHTELRDVRKAMDYIGRNYDLFLKHYYDTTFEFDDEDLLNALRNRNEYK